MPISDEEMIENKENLGEAETIAMPQQYDFLAHAKLSASNMVII
jgi:hypothetical protein